MTESTAENKRDTRADHLAEYRWQPGQSGNPSGRPRGSKSLSDQLKKLWDEPLVTIQSKLETMGYDVPDLDISVGEWLALMVVGQASQGRVEAFKEIGDRLCPRPNRSEIKIETAMVMPSISVSIGRILQASPGECSLENLPPGLDLKDIAAMPEFRPRDDDTAVADDGERDGEPK